MIYWFPSRRCEARLACAVRHVPKIEFGLRHERAGRCAAAHAPPSPSWELLFYCEMCPDAAMRFSYFSAGYQNRTSVTAGREARHPRTRRGSLARVRSNFMAEIRPNFECIARQVILTRFDLQDLTARKRTSWRDLRLRFRTFPLVSGDTFDAGRQGNGQSTYLVDADQTIPSPCGFGRETEVLALFFCRSDVAPSVCGARIARQVGVAIARTDHE
jgi:hypothetical protein